MCFLQDDMQLVRTVTPEDIQRLEHFFATAAKPCFMRPTFLHHRNPVKDKRLTRYDLERRVYYVDRFKTPFIRMSACLDYSDVCLSRPKDLRAVGWAFVPRVAKQRSPVVDGRHLWRGNSHGVGGCLPSGLNTANHRCSSGFLSFLLICRIFLTIF